MPGPSLGTNLSGLADWATNYPFVNQFLMTRDWFTQSSTQWNSNQAHLLDLDENGWVRAFTADGSPAPFQSVATIWQTNGSTFRPGSRAKSRVSPRSARTSAAMSKSWVSRRKCVASTA